MSGKLPVTLMDSRPLGKRLVMAIFASKYTNLSFITYSAPIEDAEDVQKDVFYDQLQQTIQEVPSHDVLCVIKDFNACVRNDNEGRSEEWVW